MALVPSVDGDETSTLCQSRCLTRSSPDSDFYVYKSFLDAHSNYVNTATVEQARLVFMRFHREPNGKAADC